MTFFEIMTAGGFVMPVLMLCSVYSVAVLLLRVFGKFSTKKAVPRDLLREVPQLVRLGKLEQARSLCFRDASALSRLYVTVLDSTALPYDEAQGQLARAGRAEFKILMSHLSSLNTIATLGPLLGLLGTVSGMIKAFYIIRQGGIVDPTRLAGGISEALISTAAGLIVAIIAYVLYRFFLSQARNTFFRLDSAAKDLFDELRMLIRSGSLQAIELGEGHLLSRSIGK